MTIPAWIAVGAVVLGLVLLLLAALALLRRFGPLRGAAQRLQEQANHVDELQKRLDGLQPRIDEVNRKVEQQMAKMPRR